MKTKLLSFAVILCTFMFIAATPDGYSPGNKAIDFKLKNVDGKMVSLADYKDAKGFIVTFTCNHCPFSKAYEDRIIALHNKYASQGYPVVAINSNDKTLSPEDSFEGMVVRAKEKNFPFAYLYDESQEIAKTYGATRTPHMYILKKEGSDLTVKYVGAIDDNSDDPSMVTKKYLENAMDEIIAGKDVTTNSTKAIGCTIKWKGTK
ncbi:MAG: thioredoxin family protein [Bacteroidota bacterium]